MTLMQWTIEMSVGVPELDEDHKKLIAILNRLAEESAQEPRQEIVRQCLFALRRYAEAHFAREENVMAACGYPTLSAHRELHRGFVTRIQATTQSFDAAPDDLAAHINDELLRFLKDWLGHHISIEDQAYRPFAEAHIGKARGAAQSFRAADVWHSS